MSQSAVVRGVKTKITQDGDDTVVTYRGTEVVRFNDEVITLNSAGWRTVTTKLRMNQTSNQFGLDFHVYQKDFDWFVKLPGQTWDEPHAAFQDGWKITRRHC